MYECIGTSGNAFQNEPPINRFLAYFVHRLINFHFLSNTWGVKNLLKGYIVETCCLEPVEEYMDGWIV